MQPAGTTYGIRRVARLVQLNPGRKYKSVLRSTDLSLPEASVKFLSRLPSCSQSTTRSTGENHGCEMPDLTIGAHRAPAASCSRSVLPPASLGGRVSFRVRTSH